LEPYKAAIPRCSLSFLLNAKSILLAHFWVYWLEFYFRAEIEMVVRWNLPIKTMDLLGLVWTGFMVKSLFFVVILDFVG